MYSCKSCVLLDKVVLTETQRGAETLEERQYDSDRWRKTRGGSEGPEGKRRQQSIARAITEKGHVQEETQCVFVDLCQLCLFVVCVVSCVNSRLAGFKQSELTEVCAMD